nr:MAG TPA: hypothetical protein [Caudoviricetes sp.]
MVRPKSHHVGGEQHHVHQPVRHLCRRSPFNRSIPIKSSALFF